MFRPDRSLHNISYCAFVRKNNFCLSAYSKLITEGNKKTVAACKLPSVDFSASLNCVYGNKRALRFFRILSVEKQFAAAEILTLGKKSYSAARARSERAPARFVAESAKINDLYRFFDMQGA